MSKSDKKYSELIDKASIIETFDPNSPAIGEQLFGLPFGLENSEIVVLPCPWEVTVSYRAGTAKGPAAILDASFQVDLYDPFFPDLWKLGIWMAPIPEKWRKMSKRMRKQAKDYIGFLLEGKPESEAKEYAKILAEINQAGADFNEWVMAQTSEYMAMGKKVILLGGDHSTPLGYIQALAGKNKSFGILHLDAHADLRKAFEDFTYSHASIMYNALQLSEVQSLVSVGIRDYCLEESEYVKQSKGRVLFYTDRDIKNKLYEGGTWSTICDQIIQSLPKQVYLSIDIDCFDPKLCPNTGTPVPGGLLFEEVCYLLERLVLSGKKLIGADLVEVSPGNDEWDASVGARLLYRLAGYMAKAT